MSIIGGADGPTTIFVAGELGSSWLNTIGLILMVLIMIPNIIYGIKFKNVENKCTNKTMNIVEQIGRYVSMFLMVFNIGLAEFGFASVGSFLIYLFGNGILVFAYLVIWVFYFVKQKPWKSMALAIIPTLIFLISGMTMRHVLLVISAAFFGIGHIYVTSKNC